ncbi:MAG: hypothetical protein K1X94_06665 [Sandaracinaceae bacterium]|nr:hypothetical protein [Sandaracinaceae bacterium]
MSLPRRELALTLGMLLALGVAWPHVASWMVSRPVPALAALVVGVVLGALARHPRRRRIALGVAAAACLAWTIEPLRLLLDVASGPAPEGAADRLAYEIAVSGRVLLGLLAALAVLAPSGRSGGVGSSAPILRFCAVPAGPALAAGLVLLAPIGRVDETLGLATSLAALAASLVTTSEGPALSDAVRAPEQAARIALGTLAGLCVLGLADDLAATMAPSDLAEHLRRWAPDSMAERATRAVFELATLLAVAAFARGRTWGALALIPAACGLAFTAWAFRGPIWGRGCVAYLHPLSGTPEIVLLPAAVALAPWTAPIARALWPRR